MTQAPRDLVPYTCPACRGVLHEAVDEQYICAAGHVYTLQTLSAQQAVDIEQTLWTVLRALEEQHRTLNALVQQEQAAGNLDTSHLLEESAAQAMTYAEALRTMLTDYSMPLMPD
jgi:hypothetical protein